MPLRSQWCFSATSACLTKIHATRSKSKKEALRVLNYWQVGTSELAHMNIICLRLVKFLTRNTASAVYRLSPKQDSATLHTLQHRTDLNATHPPYGTALHVYAGCLQHYIDISYGIHPYAKYTVRVS